MKKALKQVAEDGRLLLAMEKGWGPLGRNGGEIQKLRGSLTPCQQDIKIDPPRSRVSYMTPEGLSDRVSEGVCEGVSLGF